MDKVNGFTGQPILSQVLDLINSSLINRNRAARKYKTVLGVGLVATAMSWVRPVFTHYLCAKVKSVIIARQQVRLFTSHGYETYARD